MKNTIKILSVVCLAFLAFSCSKDKSPADTDLFVGTYEGSVGFTDGDTNISSDNSSVTIVKVGNDYNFRFNESGIPTLDGVKFKNDGDKQIINVDFEDGVQAIRVTESKLTMLYMRDGKTWTANATR